MYRPTGYRHISMLVFSGLFFQRCHFCPSECNCASNEHRMTPTLTVNCSYRKLTSFPSLLDMAVSIYEPSAGRQSPRVILTANGNRFRYLLRNKIATLAPRLFRLEAENNQRFIDVATGTFSDLTSAESLESLRVGPLRGDVCGVLNQAFAFARLRELSITGSNSAFIKHDSYDQNSGVCALNATGLPVNLRSLSIINCGTVALEGAPQWGLSVEELKLIGLRLTHPPLLSEKLMASTLKHLDLSRNYIASLWHDKADTISAECVLETLILSYNKISNLRQETLEKCTRLKSLDISHNPLLILDSRESGLVGAPFLTLDLSYTRVTSLQTISPERVSLLRMFNAELKCDCENLAQDILGFLTHGGVIQGTCHHRNKSLFKDLKQLLRECFSVDGKIPRAAAKRFQSEDKSHHFSPVCCSLCALACIIYGVLLFAVVFNSWNSLLVKYISN